MTVEDFEKLECGEFVRNESTGDCFRINQVRAPGFYVASLCDATTLEPIAATPYALRSGEQLVLHGERPRR